MAIRKEDKIAGAVIRRLRRRSGMTQEVLAESLGVSYQQVQKYETGSNRISISRLFDIAECLLTTPATLVQLIEHDIMVEKEFH